MSNKVKVMVGHTVSDCKDISWGDAEFVTEVQTNGEDTNGYQFQETLGVFKDEFEGLGLFKGSTDRPTFERCSAIHMSNCGHKLSESLLELSKKLDEMGL